MFKISSIIFCSIFNLIIGLFQKTHSIDFCSLIMEPRFLPTSYIEAPPRPFWAKWPPPSVPVRDPSPESPRRTSSSAHPPTFYVALFPIGPPSLPTPLSGANGAARRRPPPPRHARALICRSLDGLFLLLLATVLDEWSFGVAAPPPPSPPPVTRATSAGTCTRGTSAACGWSLRCPDSRFEVSQHACSL